MRGRRGAEIRVVRYLSGLAVAVVWVMVEHLETSPGHKGGLDGIVEG